MLFWLNGTMSDDIVPDISGSSAPERDPRKTRQPYNTAFRQQRLPAWQPVLNARSVLPISFCISLAFIPIGVILLLESDKIIEVSHDYTSCIVSTSGLDCANVRSNSSTAAMAESCDCYFTLELKEAMNGEVFVYYGLSNFFQNHRIYVKSRDDAQLNGQSVDTTNINKNCKPYAKPNNIVIYAPAGAIANSMFNDTFTMSGAAGAIDINLTGIAWPTDKNQKFNNPESFEDTVKPAYWQKNVQELNPSNPSNNGYKNEAFIVWMRTAAAPTFRKPYGRIASGIPVGTYTVAVSYNYPVLAFDGTKKFILSTTSWIGGKNIFLGIAFIAVGTLYFAATVALHVVHSKTKAVTAPQQENKTSGHEVSSV